MNAPLKQCHADRTFHYQSAPGITFGGFDIRYDKDTKIEVTENPGLFIGLMLSGRSSTIRAAGQGEIDVPVGRPIFINFSEETICRNSFRKGEFCAGVGIHIYYDKFTAGLYGGLDSALSFLSKRFDGQFDFELLPKTPVMNDLAETALTLSAGKKFQNLDLEALMMGFLAAACRGLDQSSHLSGTLSETENARVQMVAEHLQQNLTRTPSLAELSRLAAINPGTLADNFKSAFGQTIFSYFRELKLNEARRILRCETVSVTEISARVGYTNPTAFATAYRRQFGHPPSHEQLET